MTRVSLVIGPPGTGKTHYLARQAELAVAKYGPGAVLAGSLTRTAAENLAARVPTINKKHVGTLHALALRTLGALLLAETPEGIGEWNAAHPTRQLQPAGADDDHISETSKLHAAVMARRAVMAPTTTWTIAEQGHHARWEDFKRQTHRRDFTDLIELATNAGPHPHRPSVILVDEAQDLSPLEHALIDRWGATAEHLVLVGDPDQALFTWRGADPSALTGRTADHHRTLSQSYRVPKAVHAAALRWYGQTTGSYEPRDDPGQTGRVTRTLKHPDGLVHLVTRRLDSHPDETLMVLATCRHMIDPVARALTLARIPTWNPYRPEARRWNNTGDGRRLTAFTTDPWTLTDLAAWVPMINDAPPELVQLAASAAKHPDRVAPPDLLFQLYGFDHPATRRELAWLATNLKPAWRRRISVPLHHALRGGSWEPRTTVGTIHSVKGGEADTVILAPDLSRTAQWAAGAGARQAIRRLGYVGITRARSTLLVTTPAAPERMAMTV